MKSLKVKLVSVVSAFILALSLLIVGVWAVGETQTITMNGSVNFEIADKSLYVQDVRMQEDVNSTPYSLKDQGKFLPGFINGNFDMNLGDFTNSYGSFALYFDIINTMDETTNETFAYTVEQPTAPSGTTVSVSILGTDGTTLEQIPQGTVKPSEISDSTLVTATIKLTIATTSSSTVDLGNITLTINQFIPQIYDYFTFEVNGDGKTVTLTDYNKNLSDSTDVVIPATVDLVDGVWQDGTTYTVTTIADGGYNTGVFYDSGITSVTFPLSLTSIGSYVFSYCSGLTSVDLSGCTNLTSIGGDAFSYCSGLTSLTLPSSLKAIGSYAFYDCSGLTSLTLPSSLTSIGSYAFGYCSGLTGELNLGGCTSLTSIGRSAFQYCSGLTSVDLSGCTNLTSIGDDAFRSCSGLKGELNLGECTSLTSIGIYAFRDCSGLTSVDLSGCTSLTSIGDYAFAYCSKLTSISLPSSLTSIGSDAFSSCSGLTSVDLSGCTNLTSIGSWAFNGCSALKSVVFPVGSTGWEVSTSSSMTNPRSVSVTDPSTNASNLTGQYSTYYWKRNA